MDDRQGDYVASPHHVSSFQDSEPAVQHQIQTTEQKEMGRKNIQLVSICVQTDGWGVWGVEERRTPMTRLQS